MSEWQMAPGVWTGKKPDDGPIAADVPRAIAALLLAQNLNNTLQSKHALGCTEWHVHESIDDQLHEALKALGQ